MILTTISAPTDDCNTKVLRQMLRGVFREFNPFPILFREVSNLWFGEKRSRDIHVFIEGGIEKKILHISRTVNGILFSSMAFLSFSSYLGNARV